MPTNLPAQPWLRTARTFPTTTEREQRDEFFVVLSFALSPLAVLLVLLFLTAPSQMSSAYVCGEEQCVAP
jgi:hypothetical protein